MTRPFLPFAFALLLGATLVRATPIRLAATPAISPDGQHLVFEWREDLWIASTTGGLARVLTTHPAVDRFPVFSPDGRSLAFMSERDGTPQVWRMDLPDGAPRMLTFHSGGAVPQDWSPDGRTLLIRATRDSGDFHPQRFYTLDADTGGNERLLFDASGDWARYAPDGTQIAWVRRGEDPYRRGYRGSKAAVIWTYHPGDGSFTERLKSPLGADCRWPLWRPDGQALYYVREADDGRCFNLWQRDLTTGQDSALTAFTEDPVRFPALSRDGSTLVFRAGVDFQVWRPASGQPPQRLDLRAPPDGLPPRQTRLTYTSAVNYDEYAAVDFSADGKEIVFTSGGHLWVMDTQVREPVSVTAPTDAQDNWAFFSAEGDRLLFLRDTGDRANLWEARRADPSLPWWRNTRFVTTALTDDTRARRRLVPDLQRRRVAWNEAPGSLWVGTPGSNDAVRVVQSVDDVYASWSPDGKWLVCDVEDDSDNRDIWIVAADGATPPTNLSRQPDWDGGPVWSPDGRGIAYLSRSFDGKVSIRHVWLRRADHGLEERDTAELPGAENAKETRIDFEGLPDRVRSLDLNVSSPSHLFWSWDGKALGLRGTVDGKTGTWKTFFPHPKKMEAISTHRGEQMQWRKNGLFWVVDNVPHEGDRKLHFVVRLTRDDLAWRRLGLRKVWRHMRDRFYDEAMNNLDWPSVLARLEPLVEEVDDTGYARLFSMMFGELNASHTGYTPSKPPAVPGVWQRETGHPGVRFDLGFSGPGLRVAEVIPDGPADRGEARLRVGDVLTEFEHLDALYRRLDGPLPRSQVFQVRREGSNLTVRIALASNEDIRKLARDAEERETRRRVQEWSQGRLGYLAIRGMKTENLRQFETEVFAEGLDREGLVIDVRNNTGGFTADSILNILLYPRHALTIPRGGGPAYQGGYLKRPSWEKPITVLCNPQTASNGEIFSHAIKATGRGRLVGEPTQGAVISTSERPVLDLGTFRLPLRGWFSLPSGMDMDRQGAVPDLVVADPPDARRKGEDPQLRAAVEALLRDLDQKPPPRQLRYGTGRTVDAPH
jgi:tricorn protease